MRRSASSVKASSGSTPASPATVPSARSRATTRVQCSRARGQSPVNAHTNTGMAIVRSPSRFAAVSSVAANRAPAVAASPAK